MVIPHGGGPSRAAFTHILVLFLLIGGGVAVLLFAAFMVADYWRNIFTLSQLPVYERRERDATRKLQVMERGVGELAALSERVDDQYGELVKGYRLGEVRPAEALLPAKPAAAETLEGT